VDIESRVERLQELINEDRIVRGYWTGVDEQGRETACLLAALSPEVAEAETASACPASLMPLWFAHLTPWLDDHSSATAWPQVIRRYAACANQWHTLDEAAWRRVEVVARRAVVEEAMRHTSDEQVLDACRQVLVWIGADMPESSHAAVKATEAAKAAAMEARAAATGAAEGATEKAAEAWRAWAASTESAAKAETWRAWAASTESAAHWALAAARAESAESAAGAAMAAVRAAPWVAVAASEAVSAAVGSAAASDAEHEASDRIIDAVLSYLEKECGL
jgi:hypothetical protein